MLTVKPVKPMVQQRAGGHVESAPPRRWGVSVAQNVDIALHELAQTALLGALSAEHPGSVWMTLKGLGQLVLVGGVVAAQRQG